MRTHECPVSMLAALLCLATIGSAFADTIAFRTVALTGDAAPGTPTDVTFSLFFGDPVIDGAGHCAFMARLAGPDVDASNDLGLWSEGSGSVELLAREGNQAPGLQAGVLFASCHADVLCPPVINDGGDAAFFIGLSDGSSSLWVHRSGSLNLVARTGAQAPGLPAGVFFGSLNNLVLNDAGQTAFSSFLLGRGVNATNDFGIWSEASGSVAIVARRGDPAPGTPEGVVFGGGNILSSFAIGGAGQTPINAFLSGPGVIPGFGGNAQGIWSGVPGALELVARAGDPAPGLPEGVNFGGFSTTALTTIINGAGQMGFFANLIGPEVDSSNDGSIWSEGSGSLAMVAREGLHAPGTPAGVVFSSLIPGPMLNGAGQTAFMASLIGPGVDGTNNVGVWSEGSGSLALVARKGSQAPGTAAGVTFTSIFPGPVTNGAGQVALTAWLTGAGVDGSNNFGVWAQDHNGFLTLVIREGDPLEVAAGDVRTVLSVFMTSGETAISGGEDGREINFNDAGQLTFRVVFTDFSGGLFVSSFEIPGDIDADGDVDSDDLDALVAVLLGMPLDPAHVAKADLNDDGKSDGKDIGPFVNALLAP